MSLFTLNFSADVGRIERKVDAVLSEQRKQGEKIMLDFQRLEQQVTSIKSASDAAEAALNAIGAELRELRQTVTDMPTMQARLDELASKLENEAGELASAVAANTSSAPAPSEPSNAPPSEEPPAS